MKNITKGVFIITFLFIFVSLSGCKVFIHDVHKDDHKGDHRHGPPWHDGVLSVDLNQEGNGYGDVSFTMPNGEVYKGEYNTIPWSETASFFGKSDYQEYYGQIGVTDGEKCEQITAYGEKGTVIRAELFTIGNAYGCGLAKDNEGSIYRFKY